MVQHLLLEESSIFSKTSSIVDTKEYHYVKDNEEMHFDIVDCQIRLLTDYVKDRLLFKYRFVHCMQSYENYWTES